MNACRSRRHGHTTNGHRGCVSGRDVVVVGNGIIVIFNNF